MQNYFKKAQKNNKDQLDEYFQQVKEEVESGEYFKDSLDWYMSRYVNPLVDRTIMIVVAIIATISLYALYQIINSAFPLVEEVPVVIRDYDMSRYRPMISEIRDRQDPEIRNSDEAVAKYLLLTYINDRESYDFRDSKVSDVNRKFNRVKNNSSYNEYNSFQEFMSRENADSPINNFGKNIYKTTEILSFKFMRDESKNGYEKIKWLFGAKIPSKAEIRFATKTHYINADGKKAVDTENYLARIDFTFGGLDRDAKTGILNFVVNQYKLFRIKK